MNQNASKEKNNNNTHFEAGREGPKWTHPSNNRCNDDDDTFGALYATNNHCVHIPNYKTNDGSLHRYHPSPFTHCYTICVFFVTPQEYCIIEVFTRNKM